MEIELYNGRKILLEDIESFKYYDSIYFGTDSCLMISLRAGHSIALFSEHAIDTLALLKRRVPQRARPDGLHLHAPSRLETPQAA